MPANHVGASRAIDPDQSSKASPAADRTEAGQPGVTAMPGHTERDARAGSALCHAWLACMAGCRRNWPPAGRVADQNGYRTLNNTCFWSRMAHQRTNTGICRQSGQSQDHCNVIVDNQHRQQHVRMGPEAKSCSDIDGERFADPKRADSVAQREMTTLDSIDHPHPGWSRSCARAGLAARNRDGRALFPGHTPRGTKPSFTRAKESWRGPQTSDLMKSCPEIKKLLMCLPCEKGMRMLPHQHTTTASRSTSTRTLLPTASTLITTSSRCFSRTRSPSMPASGPDTIFTRVPASSSGRAS